MTLIAGTTKADRSLLTFHSLLNSFKAKKIPYSRGEIVSLFQVLHFGDDAERCEPGFEQRKRRGVGARTPLHYCVNAWDRLPKFMKMFTLFEVSKLPYCRGRLVTSVGRAPVC